MRRLAPELRGLSAGLVLEYHERTLATSARSLRFVLRGARVRLLGPIANSA